MHAAKPASCTRAKKREKKQENKERTRERNEEWGQKISAGTGAPV